MRENEYLNEVLLLEEERGLGVLLVGVGVVVGVVVAGGGLVAALVPVQPGALAGDYVGATASATFAVGLGANVLIGGSENSFALQPVSVETQLGLNFAAGVAEVQLRTID